jgi:hypothetical protein
MFTPPTVMGGPCSQLHVVLEVDLHDHRLDEHLLPFRV